MRGLHIRRRDTAQQADTDDRRRSRQEARNHFVQFRAHAVDRDLLPEDHHQRAGHHAGDRADGEGRPIIWRFAAPEGGWSAKP